MSGQMGSVREFTKRFSMNSTRWPSRRRFIRSWNPCQ